MIARVPPGDINAVEDGLPVLLRLCTKGAQVHTIAHFDNVESIKTLNETSAAKQLLQRSCSTLGYTLDTASGLFPVGPYELTNVFLVPKLWFETQLGPRRVLMDSKPVFPHKHVTRAHMQQRTLPQFKQRLWRAVAKDNPAGLGPKLKRTSHTHLPYSSYEFLL